MSDYEQQLNEAGERILQLHKEVEHYKYYVQFEEKLKEAEKLIEAHKGISKGKSIVIQGLEMQLKNK